MKYKNFLKSFLILGVVAATSWGIASNNESTEESKEVVEVSQDVKGAQNKLKDLSLVELRDAAVPFEKVDKNKIKISTNLEKQNIKHIKKSTGKTAEKRPGGYLITTYYETDIGEGTLIVSQGVNEFGDANLQLADAKTWYLDTSYGSKEVSLGSYKALVHENDINFNTLHVITDSEIYTFAGQSTDYLIEIAKDVLKNIK